MAKFGLDLIRGLNEANRKAAPRDAFKANENARKARLAKQAAHLEASYLNEQNFVRARGDISKVGTRSPKKFYAVSRVVRKIKRAVSFIAWKYSRAASKVGSKLVTKFPKLTLPAKMLQFVGQKLPFLAKGSVARTLLPQLLKPLVRFIPYVGTALLVAEFGIPLLRWGYGLLNKPKTVKRKTTPTTEPPQFTGGQENGRIYVILLSIVSNNPDRSALVGHLHYGPIKGIRLNPPGSPANSEQVASILEINSRGEARRGNLVFEIQEEGWKNYGGIIETLSLSVISVTPLDNQPDTIVSPFNPLLTSSSNVRRMLPGESPYSDYLPGGSKYQKPLSDPTPARSLLESNKRKPLQIAIPANKSITLTTPDGNSVTVAPSTEPRVINIPRPMPRQAGSPEPEKAIAPLPLTITSPNAAPIILSTPGTGPVTISIPGQEPLTFDLTSSKNAPLPLSTIKPIGKNEPVTLNPIPALPTTTPTTTPSPAAPATQGDIKDLLIPLGTLGVLLTQIRDRTSPAEIGKAAEAATCRTTQPGGCTSNAMNNAANTGSQNTLNALGVGAQGLELGVLRVINNKLGNQIPGGLAGGVGRLSNFLGIDRIFNLINFAASLHNASMLSNNLKITLLSMLSSAGNATGLLQTAEGDNVDLNTVLNKTIEQFVVSVIGVEAYANAKVEIRKHNTIYQAATNSLNAISSMFNSIGSVIELTAEYSGKIGNSLKAAGAVSENAYQWMSEKANAKTSKFITFESKTASGVQVLDSLSEIAESVVEGQQSATEFQKANTDFLKQIEDNPKNTGVQNKAVAEEIARIKVASTADPTGEDEEGLLSFLTDL